MVKHTRRASYAVVTHHKLNSTAKMKKMTCAANKKTVYFILLKYQKKFLNSFQKSIQQSKYKKSEKMRSKKIVEKVILPLNKFTLFVTPHCPSGAE